MNNKFIFWSAILFMLTSCSTWRVENTIVHRSQKPYVIKGKWYNPIKAVRTGHREQGMASWYGKQFHGKSTSSGEKFNMYKTSAAHKTLPLGTYVEVHNKKNGKTLVVRINDRGPFVEGRIIDLSYGAAKKLDCAREGVIPVEITVVDPPFFELPEIVLWPF